jgi:hypothetical protein
VAPGSLYSKSNMNNTVDNTVSIEFGLPNGASGQAAVYHSSRLRKSITKWAEERHVDLRYSVGHREYRHWLTVEFNKESDLTLFVLSWNGDSFMPWRRVELTVGPVNLQWDTE